MKFYINLIVLLLFKASLSYSQSYSIIHVEGDAFVYVNSGEKKSYNKIVIGSIANFEKIVIKDKASVRIKKGKHLFCDLNKEGSYSIEDLKFKEIEDNSVFGKFCQYFESFFTNHSSSESKNNYKNSIYAISRGIAPPPSLDFPLQGNLPVDAGSLPFIWTHACDSCEYIFTVNDFSNREVIYTIMTKEKRIDMPSPQKYLKPNHQYYWTVKIAGKEMEYENVEFSTAENGTFQKLIADISKEADSAEPSITGISKALFILGAFEIKEQHNFALLYSFQALRNTPEDANLIDIIDRYWYDQLLSK